MRVIDDTVGQTFDLLLEDFDEDGRIDFLLTSYDDTIGVRSGSVYIYLIPDDLLYVFFFTLFVYLVLASVCSKFYCAVVIIVQAPGLATSSPTVLFLVEPTLCLPERLSPSILALPTRMKSLQMAGQLKIRLGYYNGSK